MMATVELIYDANCPNVAMTRAHLLRAFQLAGHTPRWNEWDRDDPTSPAPARQFGSPTLLVDGRDLAGEQASGDADCCRLYMDEKGRLAGVPSVETIAAALTSADGNRRGEPPARKCGFWSVLAAIPGIGAALLPVGLCPACWPAYAGVLTSLGLGFLLDASYLLPVTAVLLLVVVWTLAYRARSRRGFAPFVLGLFSALIILIGKFAVESTATMLGGVVLLMAASIWNAWPQRAARRNTAACPMCAPDGPACDSSAGASEVTS